MRKRDKLHIEEQTKNKVHDAANESTNEMPKQLKSGEKRRTNKKSHTRRRKESPASNTMASLVILLQITSYFDVSIFSLPVGSFRVDSNDAQNDTRKKKQLQQTIESHSLQWHFQCLVAISSTWREP